MGDQHDSLGIEVVPQCGRALPSAQAVEPSLGNA